MRQTIAIKNILTLSSMILTLSFSVSSLNAQTNNLKEYEQQWKKINAAVIDAYRNGKYQKGIQLAEKAYQYAKVHLGEEHPSTLTSMNNLALLYYSQGRYAEAEPLYKETLQLQEKVLGKRHPSRFVFGVFGVGPSQPYDNTPKTPKIRPKI
jgi:tetratricopeptide (TPR) repeat protein